MLGKNKTKSEEKLIPEPVVKIKESKKTMFKSLIKTAGIVKNGRIYKRLEAEKKVLEGRLVVVNNLLIQFEETPVLATAIDIILNPLEISE